MYYFVSMILTCIGIVIWFFWSIVQCIKSSKGSNERNHTTVIVNMVASTIALFLAGCFLLFVLFVGIVAYNGY